MKNQTMNYFNKARIQLFFLLPVLCLLGCGQFARNTQTVEVVFDLSDFNAIKVDAPYSVEIIQSDIYKVVVNCDAKIEQNIAVSKNGNTLQLSLHKPKNRIKVLSAKVYVPTLEKLDLSGAVNVNISAFTATRMGIIASGANDIEGNLKLSESLKINSSGANDFHLKGTTQHATLDFSGSNDFLGKEFIVENTLNANITGASSATITVHGEIHVDLSGASKLFYYGNGTVVDQRISGASKLIKK